MIINKDWQKIRVKKIRPKELEKLLEEEALYVLDVRPLNFKRDATFVTGSRLCPLVFLADRYQEIPMNKRIVITDWAMHQSPTAAKFLTTKGYQIVGVLKGGIERWKTEKLPVVWREPIKEVGPLNVP